MRTMRIAIMLGALLAVTSCKDATGHKKVERAPAPAIEAPPDAGRHEPIETTRDKMEQDRDDAKATAAADKGEDWVPAEFKSGMSRWKDTGVYVDGKPVAFLTWGELPISLKPTWVKDKVSADTRPGMHDPGWRWAKQRFYKWVDYLNAIGVPPGSVREIHIYGPKFSQTIIATGKDLTAPLAQGFMFRFGGNVFGKAIPQVPSGFGNGKTPDKINSVMIYVKKKPPKMVDNVGLELDGVLQTGVPYYGEPIRGGVRIYLDDKLAGIIKRQELDAKKATKDAEGNLEWKLADVLTAQGVNTNKVVEMWVIRDDKRTERFPAADIPSITFAASSQAKGGVMLTNKKVRANVIALHTRALKSEEIPVATADDD